LDTTAVERRAVDAVLGTEDSLGRRAEEMPHNYPGYDLRSTARDGAVSFIEVKGRLAGADSFVVTRNELLHALNVPAAYILALVEVSPEGPDGDRVRYVRHPYGEVIHLPFDTTATTLDWARYWTRGMEPS
jgi:hypothetical protein